MNTSDLLGGLYPNKQECFLVKVCSPHNRRSADASQHLHGRRPKRKGYSLAPQSVLRRLRALELQLQLVRDQGNELRIGGLALGIGNRVAEEPLQGIQVATVPGYLDGVTDGTLHSAGGGAEGLGYLRVENLGDGVACLTARWGASKRENLLRCL